MSTTQPQNCIELASRMVEFDSVVPYHSGRPDAEQALGDYLEYLAQSWGLATRQLPVSSAASNLLIECPATEPNDSWLLMDSHLDTVGVEGMTIPPFSPKVKQGRLHGRGACDTKGTGAAMFCALRKYAAQGQRPKNVALLFSVGEEHVQLGARTFVAEHLSTLDWQPSAIVVGEPTMMNVLAATGGFVRWKISTQGAAAHSSRPERGHNAIYDMARVIRAIEDQYIAKITTSNPLIGSASAAITVVHGGQQVNVVPPHCEITFDRRLVPGEEAEAEVERVRDLLAKLSTAHPGMRVEHQCFEQAPPMAVIDEQQLATACQAVLKEVDIDSRITGELFTTNGNHFAAAGIPTIVVGPGDIAQAHTVDEWVSLEQLERGEAGYLALMRELWKNERWAGRS